MVPSECSVGDMVTVFFFQSNSELGGRSVYGRVSKLSQYGAFVGPWIKESNTRVLTRSVYCADAECVIEEINGESLFEM